MIENDDVIKVYNLVSGQVITAGMDGTVIDLDYNAVLRVMELYDIPNKREVFERVVGLFHRVLKNRREIESTQSQEVDFKDE